MVATKEPPVPCDQLQQALEGVKDCTTKKQPVKDGLCTTWCNSLINSISMIFAFLYNLIIPAFIVSIFFIFIYLSKLVQYVLGTNKNHDWHPNSINEGDIFWGMITCVCIGLFSVLCALACKCGR